MDFASTKELLVWNEPAGESILNTTLHITGFKFHSQGPSNSDRKAEVVFHGYISLENITIAINDGIHFAKILDREITIFDTLKSSLDVRIQIKVKMNARVARISKSEYNLSASS